MFRNPGPGGWGAAIFDRENNQKNISGNAKNTTNNRMDTIMALKKIATNSEVATTLTQLCKKWYYRMDDQVEEKWLEECK